MVCFPPFSDCQVSPKLTCKKDEVRQALGRAGNTEEVRIREARDFPGFNPEATEFKPS